MWEKLFLFSSGHLQLSQISKCIDGLKDQRVLYIRDKPSRNPARDSAVS